MRLFLILLFAMIFLCMTVVTVQASLERPVWQNGHLMADKWFQATLCDAYFGFLTFYVWLAYKETGWLRRAVWFVAVMLLGNFAMSAYILYQLANHPTDQPLSRILVRRHGKGDGDPAAGKPSG